MFYIGKEKYRLVLRWNKVRYEEEGIALLDGAYFAGPALQISQKLNAKDEITLDITSQYSIFVPHYYLVKLSWEDIEYGSDRIHLKNAIMKNKHINSVPKLKDTDFFVIDTSKHEEKTHPHYLNYDSLLVDENKKIYRF